MLKLVLILAILATALADVSHILNSGVPAGHPATIVHQDQDVNANGSFHYSFESDNGIAVQQEGLPIQTDDSGSSVSGFFHYKSPEGVPVAVHYTADENGFQPSGDSLPVAYPIPDVILRSIEYNAAHPTEE